MHLFSIFKWIPEGFSGSDRLFCPRKTAISDRLDNITLSESGRNSKEYIR
jgi:hypothetical protein